MSDRMTQIKVTVQKTEFRVLFKFCFSIMAGYLKIKLFCLQNYWSEMVEDCSACVSMLFHFHFRMFGRVRELD